MKLKFCYIFLLLSCAIWKVQAAKRLFLVAGQSNSAGKGDASLTPAVIPGTAYEYVYRSDSLKPIIDPVGTNELDFEPAAMGSAWPAFVHTFYELTGDTLILVPAARGGSSCHEKAELGNYGTWALSGRLFNNALRKVEAAMKKTGLPLSGIIWLQGERDANAMNNGKLGQAEYERNLKELVMRFRTALHSKTPFFIVKTGYYNNHPRMGFDQVRAGQDHVAKQMDSVYIVFEGTNLFINSGLMTDEIHYNQEGLNKVGDSLAFKVANKLDIPKRELLKLGALQIKGIDEFKLRKGTVNFFKKARERKKIRVGYIGGSITQADKGYRKQTTELLKALLPNNELVELAAGIPGTDADLGACRVADQLLSKQPDLVFIEFAANGGFPQGMEGIIRQIKKTDPKIDICLVYAATVGQLKAYQEGTILTHIAKIEQLADHYQLPSVHMALYPAWMVQQEKLIAKENAENNVGKPIFTEDGVHPLTSGGNLYAAAIARMFHAALELFASGKEALPDLPSAMYVDNWEQAQWVNPQEGAIFSDGWKEVPTTGRLQQFGVWFPTVMTADKAGASCTIRFEGDAVGLFDIGGPEVGQLKVMLDGREVQILVDKGARYHVVPEGLNAINRFNINCNNRYRGQFFMLQTVPGKHEVTFSIDKIIPDKRAILGADQLNDITEHPEKYAHAQIYIGKILVKGAILHEE
jgi:lysophospholipase L1-like esterase